MSSISSVELNRGSLWLPAEHKFPKEIDRLMVRFAFSTMYNPHDKSSNFDDMKESSYLDTFRAYKDLCSGVKFSKEDAQLKKNKVQVAKTVLHDVRLLAQGILGIVDKPYAVLMVNKILGEKELSIGERLNSLQNFKFPLNEKKNLLFHAVEKNVEEWVEDFLVLGYDPNARDSMGESAIFKTDNPEIMKLLADYGADLDMMNMYGKKPIHKAGSAAYCKVLMEKGVNPHSRDLFGNTPLHTAASVSADMVQVLLDHAANVHSRNIFSMNCLAQAKSREVVELLVREGIDPNASYRFEERAIHHLKEPEAIKALIEQGADVNAADHNGRTALHMVESLEAARALIDCGADIHAKDGKGRTPFSVHKSNKEIYSLLVSRSEKRWHKVMHWWGS